MGIRRKARELALESLYSMEQSGSSAEDSLSAAGAEKSAPAAREFAEQLLRNVADNLAEIDLKIKACSINWRISRMPPTDKIILRLAVSELMLKETPPAVVINEAIEIAKKYSTEKSCKFINGVLDCVRKNLSCPCSEKGA